MLALFADHRVLAAGDYRVGLNEVRVGLPVPEVLLRALAFVVGERQAARLAVGGGLPLAPVEALRVGLVDELASLAEVVPRAVAWAAEQLAPALRDIDDAQRQPLVASFDTVDERLLTTVADQWFSDEAQATLRALTARLKKG